MRPAALLIILALPLTVSAAPIQVLNRESALTASVERLAVEALAQTAPKLVEVTRPTFSGMFGPGRELYGLRFASAPRSAGNPGLCEATTVWIRTSEDSPDYPTAPIETNTAYKVVGATKPLPDMWNDEYGAWLADRCESAGRVIETESGDFGQTTFFALSDGGANEAWFGANALEQVIAEAKRGRGTVACESLDDPADCARPQSTLAGLDLGRLKSMEVGPCERRPALTCVSADFLRSARSNTQSLWTVKVEAREVVGRDQNRHVEDVNTISLTAGTAIYD